MAPVTHDLEYIAHLACEEVSEHYTVRDSIHEFLCGTTLIWLVLLRGEEADVPIKIVLMSYDETKKLYYHPLEQAGMLFAFHGSVPDYLR